MESFPKPFGLIIAYLFPGFVVILGLSPVVPLVHSWIRPAALAAEGVGPPAYVLLSAIAIGLIVNCFRWLLIDPVLQWTGVKRLAINYANLNDNLDAIRHLHGSHYYFYLFYANTFVAIVFSYLLNRFMGRLSFLGSGTDLGMLILCTGIFVGSRDCLKKYRSRVRQVLGQVAEKGFIMVNGDDHHEEGTSPKPKPEPKTAAKQQPAGKPPQAAAKDRKSDK